MYIAPNTEIRVLKNCPLDKTFDHTIYFESVAEQTAYFKGLTKYRFPVNTYQRVNNGTMRVQRKADDLYDCNYVMFQNTNYGNKWFYAFITAVEFVNNSTSEIKFELDVMQSWWFNADGSYGYELGQCFVDREHSATDEVGDNLVPENLELGDYVTESFDSDNFTRGTSIVVAATFDGSYEDVGGAYYGGIYSGLYFNVFPNTPSGAISATEFIRGAGAKTDGIVAVFICPSSSVTDASSAASTGQENVTKFLDIKRQDGSPVKNNKVKTYPFNFLYVTNLQGNAAAFPYEYFSGDTCQFTIGGDFTCNPSVVLAPNNYKGAAVNYDEKITLTGFPQCAFSVDSFRAWLAQNASSLAVSSLGTGTQLAGGIRSSDISAQYSASVGSVSGVQGAQLSGTMATAAAAISTASAVGTMVTRFLMPDQARGHGSPSTLCAIGLLHFAFMKKHIRPEFATIIDDYFTMYGYATHRVKVPNRNVRKNWCFTKTRGCVIHGSIPADDMATICSIYDRGITFWRNGSDVGNYSLPNNPI